MIFTFVSLFFTFDFLVDQDSEVVVVGGGVVVVFLDLRCKLN